MKAIVVEKYGPPEGLRLVDIDAPVVTAGSVRVRVRAVAVNPLDWRLLRGEPILMRPAMGLTKPKKKVPGCDFAGEAEQVGADVAGIRPGDEVFGTGWGTLAEHVCIAENDLVPKPASLSFEEAAALPVAGITALEAVKDHGRVQAGHRVLINGAAGGVGTFAVQIAKAQGARVTGVCSTKNLDLVRSIGAADVVDYTTEDFARRAERYDVIIDAVGNRPLRHLRHSVTEGGRVVLCGGGRGRFFGPISQIVEARLVDRFVRQRLVTFISKPNRERLLALREMVEAGKVRPVLDRCYGQAQAAEAVRYLEAGHARGKVVISL